MSDKCPPFVRGGKSALFSSLAARLRWLTDTFQRMLVPPKIEEEQEENEDETDASVSESV